MIKFMTTFRLNKTMFFVLVTALLSMQWSTAHIHLAAHHDHDGSHHQHNTEAHAHQSLTHNNGLINSDHQIFQQEVKVVEICSDCNIYNWNNIDDQPVVLTALNFQQNFTPHINSIESSGFSNSKRRYIDYSTINLRAPPKFS